jgi:hypothetical protein
MTNGAAAATTASRLRELVEASGKKVKALAGVRLRLVGGGGDEET